MLLVDYSPVNIAAFHSASKELREPSIDLVRHLILNTIRSHCKTHKARYGETVLAVDSGSWRKDVFQYYKGKRDKKRKESDIDWQLLFEYMRQIIDELEEVYPGRLVRTPKAEADDIIGVLVKNFHSVEEIMILSPDNDMQQLLKYKGVRQWSTLLKKELKQNPHEVLVEKLIKGDRGDGIPSIRGADNAIVDSIRAKPISTEFLNEAFNSFDLDKLVLDTYGSDALRNLNRNRVLVDFAHIPSQIEESIMDKYLSSAPSPMQRNKFMNYLIKNRMSLLASDIADF